MGRTLVHIFNKLVYTKEEYERLRRENRKFFKIDPEYYCSKQVDYEPTYELSINGNVYVTDVFTKGIRYINKYFNEDCVFVPAFDHLLNLSYKLPPYFDYAVRKQASAIALVTSYVSRDYAFTHTITDTENHLKVYFPRPLSERDRKEIDRIIDNGYRPCM